ncbi:hypothetical protein BH09PSE2_BH09PSE2_11620 [soil metagenome]
MKIALAKNATRLALIASAAAVLGSLGSCAKPAEEAPYDLSLDMKELMGHVVDPGAWAFWHASGEVETAKGVTSNLPTTEEGWEAAESGAAQVAEAGNLLLLPGRNRNEKAWTEWAVKLQKAGHAAKDAAEKKDAKAMFATCADMYQVCTGCHAVYVIPEAIKAAKDQKVTALPAWPEDVMKRWPADQAAKQRAFDAEFGPNGKHPASQGS